MGRPDGLPPIAPAAPIEEEDSDQEPLLTARSILLLEEGSHEQLSDSGKAAADVAGGCPSLGAFAWVRASDQWPGCGDARHSAPSTWWSWVVMPAR